MNNRKIKIVKFTARKGFNDVEETVNAEIDKLTLERKRVISINPSAFSNTTPIYLIYTIVYEENTGN